MKILISWYAKNNDFDKDQQINPTGPTMAFHQYFFQDYDEHILLSTREENDGDVFLDKLVREITQKYRGRIVRKRFMNISDVIDFQEIKTKVETLLLAYSGDEIDIFFSPGTSVMQMSWFVCHQSLGLKTRLLQTREGKFKGKKEPDLLELKIDQSSVPMSAILSEQIQRKSVVQPDYVISESIKPIYEKARLIAQTDKVSCLIRGESGTGKEHLAHYIHQTSNRNDKGFVSVNCSALGDNLLESRLFGYVKGAFTDAKEDKKGLFDEANGGTTFLDEIGDISPFMQQTLLRVLQNGEILPVGATKPRKVDVRILAATHKDLEKMCEEGLFRWDLYYRLSMVELNLPSLQERGMDEKQGLIDFFLSKIQKEMGKPKRLKLSKETNKVLLEYPFKGNVRELENVITNLYVFCEGEVKMGDLPKKLSTKSGSKESTFKWKEVEKDLIAKALTFYKGNQTKANEALGYGSINTFRSKVREYEIGV
jgi:transcriptional regulator with PAS, ATPase and Fis domain